MQGFDRQNAERALDAARGNPEEALSMLVEGRFGDDEAEVVAGPNARSSVNNPEGIKEISVTITSKIRQFNPEAEAPRLGSFVEVRDLGGEEGWRKGTVMQPDPGDPKRRATVKVEGWINACPWDEWRELTEQVTRISFSFRVAEDTVTYDLHPMEGLTTAGSFASLNSVEEIRLSKLDASGAGGGGGDGQRDLDNLLPRLGQQILQQMPGAEISSRLANLDQDVKKKTRTEVFHPAKDERVTAVECTMEVRAHDLT